MKVLVVGSGGREHALAWKIGQSPDVDTIYCSPGNGGVPGTSKCNYLPYKSTDIPSLLSFAKYVKFDLTVVGPEQPLVDGIVEKFQAKGLPIFGHSKEAAQLEGSKSFANSLMNINTIPTAESMVFEAASDARKYLIKNWDSKPHGYVVKADGLAAGKGVYVPDNLDLAIEAVNMIMVESKYGDAGNTVVIEEKLVGEEASIIYMTDGIRMVPFPSSQDHKPVNDNDKGDNTGGMGAYSPAPVITDDLGEEIERQVMGPTVNGMRRINSQLSGFLYGGLMITDEGPKVLEFNVRMGDPEAQPLLMRTKSDIVPYMMACAEGGRDGLSKLPRLDIDPRPAVCVVMASKGYPAKYERGKLIKGLDDVERLDDVHVFHAGTEKHNGKFFTNGGRVLGVTALGKDIPEAIERAYDAVDRISCEEPGFHFRTDIGKKALDRV